jgi:predicted nucleic acid-binding protein
VTLVRGQRAVVVDASAAVPFLLGEATWIAAWRAWTTAGAMLLVPAHFGHEVANALLRSVRVGAPEAMRMLGELFSTGVEVADRGLGGLEGSVALADRHGLSVYDAAYLDLALDIDGDLATLDGPLRAAAEREGVPLLPESNTWAAAGDDPDFQREMREIGQDLRYAESSPE